MPPNYNLTKIDDKTKRYVYNKKSQIALVSKTYYDLSYCQIRPLLGRPVSNDKHT